jgi:hypothetical protein
MIEGSDFEETSIKEKWSNNSKLNGPYFGFKTNQEDAQDHKMAIMEKIQFLTDKLELVNRKIVDRKIELDLFD